jgi:hypothetical protein
VAFPVKNTGHGSLLDISSSYFSLDAMQKFRPHYESADFTQFTGNPFPDALLPRTPKHKLLPTLTMDSKSSLARVRCLPIAQRPPVASELLQFNLPRKIASDVAEAVDNLIWHIYQQTNPLEVEFIREQLNPSQNLQSQISGPTTAPAILLTGTSGMGKSYLIRCILCRFPQVIRHTKYMGIPFVETQIVWLRVEITAHDNIIGFLLDILKQFDEATGLVGAASYGETHRHSSIAKLTSAVIEAAKRHHLAVLNVEDLQRISENSIKFNSKFINLIILLANRIGCLLIFTATPNFHSRWKLRQDVEIELMRRITSVAHFELERPTHHDDISFRGLVAYCSSLQYLDEPLLFTEVERAEVYRLSAGITSVVIQLFAHAQIYAISEGAVGLKLTDFQVAFRCLEKKLQALVQLLVVGSGG